MGLKPKVYLATLSVKFTLVMEFQVRIHNTTFLSQRGRHPSVSRVVNPINKNDLFLKGGVKDHWRTEQVRRAVCYKGQGGKGEIGWKTER